MIEKQQENSLSGNEQFTKLLEVLNEPDKWEDDQVHPVNWNRFLQLLQSNLEIDVNQLDKVGNSLLKKVITSPRPNTKGTEQEPLERALVVEELLKRGADLNSVTDELGNTALHEASGDGYFPVVEVLLKYNVNVNATNSYGSTALLFAATPHTLRTAGFPSMETTSYAGHIETVKALLKAGADVNIRNKNGTSPLMEAKKAGNQPIIDLLQAAGAKE